jgi:hypothetical protein
MAAVVTLTFLDEKGRRRRVYGEDVLCVAGVCAGLSLVYCRQQGRLLAQKDWRVLGRQVRRYRRQAGR